MLLSFLILAAGLAASDAPAVTIDLKSTVVEHFMGMGVQWDPYEYPASDAAWKLTLNRLDFMRPAFLRVMWTADPYCLGFDAAGNPQYVWDRDDAEVRERLGPLFKILDYAQSRGIDVMLGEWNQPKSLSGPQDPRWARMVADFVLYLVRQRKYTVIRYYNLFNEPNGNWMWPQGKVNYDAWATGIRSLRRELDARGLESLAIAGPDNSGNWEWLDRCARDLPGEIGFWEMHWYVKDKELLDGEIEKLLASKRQMLLATDPQAKAKNLYMGEAGIIQGRVNGDQQPRVKDYDYGVLMADFVAQVARAGWMGASAWDLDDAMHVVNGRRHPPVPDNLTLKVWGFWNTQGSAMGHPEDEGMRPWFYTWSLMSRLFPKGARITGIEESGFPPGLRTIAAQAGDGLSVMLVNDAADSRTVTLRMPGYGGKKLLRWDYFEHDRPLNRNGFPVEEKKKLKLDRTGAAQLEFPGRGVLFLSDREERH
jgi:hypothetical protein